VVCRDWLTFGNDLRWLFKDMQFVFFGFFFSSLILQSQSHERIMKHQAFGYFHPTEEHHTKTEEYTNCVCCRYLGCSECAPFLLGLFFTHLAPFVSYFDLDFMLPIASNNGLCYSIRITSFSSFILLVFAAGIHCPVVKRTNSTKKSCVNKRVHPTARRY